MSATAQVPQLTERELTLRKLLRDDFIEYSQRALFIRPKKGDLQPLKLNRAQKYLHQRIEEQRAMFGWVRALILKGRQQGISTYTEGRFYWRVSHRKGVRAYILTHEDSATQNLYEIATRYHEHCPQILRPHTGAANAKELYFDLLDSGYKVGTAGTKAVGRSSTLQFFHGSEISFWPFAEDHAAGVLQAVPRETDTEILLESTANGIGNLFHSMWQDAEIGKGDYIAVFLPWWWQDEYTANTEGFTPTPEELTYQEHSPEITHAHLAWRRIKITEIGPDLFKREYPANAAEAFQATGEESFISPASVLKARKSICPHDDAPLIVGLDPAYMGSDRTVFAFRRGRRVYNSITLTGKDNMEVAGFCANILRSGVWLPDSQMPVQIVKVFIDLGGMPGIYDRLRELGFGDRVIGVNFGSNALQETAYVNRRAEMWGLLKEWLKGPCQLPDSDTLQADLCGVQNTFDSSGRLKLEQKEHMRKRGLRSPDEGDALALTFAMPVSRDALIVQPIEQRQPNADGFYF